MSNDARMVAFLEARITDYEKKMDRALGISKKNFGGISNQAQALEKKVASSMSNTAQVISTLHGPLGGVASRFSSFGSTVSRTGLIAGTLTTAIGGLTFAATKAISAFTLFETQSLTTQQVIRATGGAAGKTATDIERLSQEIALVTLASREGARSAANQLLTFKSVTGDTFDRTMRVAQDLAAVGFGTIESAAVQLGKALEDPIQGISQLREVGVSFSAQQRKIIKDFVDMGNVAEAQKEILKAVEGQVGGAGAAAGGGLAGAWDTLSETTGIVLEQWGEAISKAIKLKEAIGGLSEAIGTLRLKQDSGPSFESTLSEVEREALRIARQRDQEEVAKYGRVGFNEPMFKSNPNFRKNLVDEVTAQKEKEKNDALEGFIEQERKAAARTREQIALEKEAGEVLKRAKEEGVVLTRDQAEAQAKVNLRLGEESGAVKKTVDEFTKRQQSVTDTIRLYELEAEVMTGLTDTTLTYNEALEMTKVISELLLVAEKEGVVITDEKRAKIEELAAAQVEANRQFEEAAKKYKDASKALESIDKEGSNAMKTLISDLSRGKSASEALAGALSKVGDKLLDIAFDGIFGGIGKSGGGGILGSIGKFFGFRAEGGNVEKGKPYIVGERRPELFVPDSAGRIVPRVPQQSGGGSGGTVVNITTPAGDKVEQQRSRRGGQDIVDVVIKRTGQTYGLKRPPTRT